MGLVAQKTSPSPRLGRQGFTNVSHLKNRVYDYPQDQPPGATHPVKLARFYLHRISPALVHGFKTSPSALRVVPRDCPMHTQARRLVHEFQVVRDL